MQQMNSKNEMSMGLPDSFSKCMTQMQTAVWGNAVNCQIVNCC